MLVQTFQVLRELNDQENKNSKVVLWHGMGDNCCHSFSMGAFEKMIRHHVPGVDYIRSLMIGTSETADTENGFVMPVEEQLEMACAMIKNDTRLANGYNAIGFSYGDLIKLQKLIS